MSAGTKRPLAEAEQIAAALIALLAPACQRIEVAGSIRRKRLEVSDVELVAVPILIEGRALDLFSEPPKESLLDVFLRDLARSGALAAHPERPAAGDRYKRLWDPEHSIQIDLFVIRAPAEWGPIFAIRTGSATYSHAAVTALQTRGLRCQDGAIWRGNERVPCPDEETFFALCGMPFRPPQGRG